MYNIYIYIYIERERERERERPNIHLPTINENKNDKLRENRPLVYLLFSVHINLFCTQLA
jgi:hypothetical protein